MEGDSLHFLKPPFLSSEDLLGVSVHVSSTLALVAVQALGGLHDPIAIIPILQIRAKPFKYLSKVTRLLGDRVKI